MKIHLAPLLFFVFFAVLACSAPPEKAPPANAGEEKTDAASEDPRRPRHDLLENLRADLAAQRHPSDGGGRAWLEDGGAVAAGQGGRWTILYEAGPEGIAEGGMLFLQVSPFWGWSTPQTESGEGAGYTTVTLDTGDADGVTLEARTLDEQLLGITVGGRALREGERVRIVYGAGPGTRGSARADRYAERRSRFWIAVDGDGDGIRKVLADSPSVDVLPGPPARLLAFLPSTARPGSPARLTLAVVDAAGNGWADFTGEVRLAVRGGEAPPGLPSTVRLGANDRGRREVVFTPREPGVVRLEASAAGLPAAVSNPMQVSSRGLRILWGDLHCHSGFSDGTAVPEDLLRYAREVAALDVVALTDHDHWGMLFLDANPDLWEEIREAARAFHEPGRFVTVPAFEWTNWIDGHRHVLFFDESEAEVLSSVDPRWDHPEKLWAALRGKKALTVAHHSAGGPIATDWSIAPDPELEPVTEVVSVHGVSEASDSPSVIYRPVAGNFVRDALGRGYRLGFLGSGDSHDGHPGLAHLASPIGGLAAILADDLTREGVYQALKQRRVYATSGPRIVLRLTYGGYQMGADVPLVAADGGRQAAPGAPVAGIPADTLVAQVQAEAPIARIDVVRSGSVQGLLCEEGAWECSFALPLRDLEDGEYLYLRVVQEDGGLAWSSPFFFNE